MEDNNPQQWESEAFEISSNEKFFMLLDELEHCVEIEQKRKIEEMNKTMEVMNLFEFKALFTEELFNKLDEMIEEEKLSIENVTWLLKRMGLRKVINQIYGNSFDDSELSKRIEDIIFYEEDEESEDKNEKLLVDLCHCFTFLAQHFSPELLSICMSCLLKVALNKEESEEVRKEVELALFSLNILSKRCNVPHELYLDEIAEVLRYHQRHHNLTRAMYQSAWQILIVRLYEEKSLERIITDQLHFGREITRELDALAGFIDWKKKEEMDEKRRAEEKEARSTILKWISTLRDYVLTFQLRKEENIELFRFLVRLCIAARENEGEIFLNCFKIFRILAHIKAFKFNDLLESGIVDLMLEEVQHPSLDDKIEWNCLIFILDLCRRYQRNKHWRFDFTKWKMRRRIYDRLEEEGLEDIIISLDKTLNLIIRKFRFLLSPDITEYSVHT